MDRIATIRTTMLFVVCYLKSVTINVHFRKADLAHKHCYLLFLSRSVISQCRKMRATAALPSCIGWAVNLYIDSSSDNSNLLSYLLVENEENT